MGNETSTSASDDASSSTTPQSSESSPSEPPREASSDSALRKYVETFDQATMVETARIVSQEGAALLERQTYALFGDTKKLTQQMQVILLEQRISYPGPSNESLKR